VKIILDESENIERNYIKIIKQLLKELSFNAIRRVWSRLSEEDQEIFTEFVSEFCDEWFEEDWSEEE